MEVPTQAHTKPGPRLRSLNSLSSTSPRPHRSCDADRVQLIGSSAIWRPLIVSGAGREFVSPGGRGRLTAPPAILILLLGLYKGQREARVMHSCGGFSTRLISRRARPVSLEGTTNFAYERGHDWLTAWEKTGRKAKSEELCPADRAATLYPGSSSQPQSDKHADACPISYLYDKAPISCLRRTATTVRCRTWG